jgi:hypothetical protein
MIPTLTAYEAQALRDAVKEASVKAKAHRERWAVGRTQLQPGVDVPELAWQGLVDADAADVFVETLLLALRRSGGFVFFLE